ncbi:MAG: outer membrane protein assembly factor BamE [Acetobacteraceae bacterium]|jgi:outer membrane protein assembly factor BamE (lipoprotein component of BamABCDE complex)|nr:outer membrane protein assembly factor BamE [Acetobacteraceae bacterium]
MRKRPHATLLLAGTLLGSTLLAGCGIADASKDARGHRVDRELLAELVPGVQTRSDVSALLGSPSATATFGEDTWYYIGGVTQNRVGRKDALIEQEVVAVHFDRNGVLQRVEVVEKADATPIDPVARITPTPGTEVSFIGMILGNIGRFGGAQQSRTGPGAPGL